MSNVKRYRDRLGNERLYFRAKGHPCNGVRLKGPWPDVWKGSSLEAEVAGLLGLQPTKPRPGNLAAATRSYELSADFTGLGSGTQYIYRLMLKEFDADLGSLRLEHFTSAFILSLRDAWATRGHRAANQRLQVLKNVLMPQLIAADLPDPFSRIRQVRRPGDTAEPHPIWPEAVLKRVLEEAITRGRFGVARAVVLARYTGARRGDLVRLRHSARVEGRIAWLSGKRKMLVDMPEDPLLTAWLDKIPSAQPLSKWRLHRQRKTGVVHLPPTTLVFNTIGRPYTESGLGQELAKIVFDLHEAGELDTDKYDLHGLRHTFGVEAALAGCSDAQGAALMGHHSPNSFSIYRRQAARLTLSNDGAGLIAALRDSTARTAAEQQVSNRCLKVSNSRQTGCGEGG